MISRLIGLGLLVLAALSLGGDIWKMQQTGEFDPRALGARWSDVSPESLVALQNLVERYISSDLWNPGVVTVLLWPAWAVLGGVGIAFLLLSRRRRKKVI